MMSKKDYVRAAALVREEHIRTGDAVRAASFTQLFVEFFRGDNPRFDAERFRQACEPDA